MSIEHEHCASCYDCNCKEEKSDCAVVSCRNQCGSRFHACKEDEHIVLCPRELVACVNLHNGCPFSFERSNLGLHLANCPASIVCCSHTWFRRNKAEPGDGVCSDPALPAHHLDFALARRDQERVGGANCLRELTVAARPVQRQCPGIGLDPREDAPDTLTAAIFSVHDNAPPADCEQHTLLWNRLSMPPEQLPIFNHLPPSNSNTPDSASACSRSSELEVGDSCSDDGSLVSCGGTSDGDTPTTGYKSATENVDGCMGAASSTSDVDQSATTSELSSSDDRQVGSAAGGLETVDEDADGKKSPRERSDSKKEKTLKKPASYLRRKRFAWKKTNSDSVESIKAPPAQARPADLDSISSTSVSTKFRIHLKHGKHRISKAVTEAIGISRQVKQSASLTAFQQQPRSAKMKHMAIERARWSYSDSMENDSEVILLSGSSAVSSSSESGRTLSPLVRSLSGQSGGHGGSELQKERWEFSTQLSRPTSVLDVRDEKLRQPSTDDPLFFELPHFFAPRHISPADRLVQCQCCKFFRRDEIAGHQEFVHAGVDSVLTAHLFSERCPMAAYGCEHVRQALVMPQCDWVLRLTKRSLAIKPSTQVTPQALQAENVAEPRVHLTTLPVRVLRRVCAFLDPLSLTCVAETCTHLRQLVSSLVKQRGMVCPVWERSETEDGDFTWTAVHYTWTLSSYVTPIPMREWLPSNEKPLKEHLRTCDLLNRDRHEYGHQWQPLLGLTDVERIEVVGDSDEPTGVESDDECAPMASGCKTADRGSQARLSVSNSVRSGMVQPRRSRARSSGFEEGLLAVAMDDCDVICDDDCAMDGEENS